MGWLIAGVLLGWFVLPQPEWKALGAKVLAWVVTRKAGK